jgi:hypothetical protein
VKYLIVLLLLILCSCSEVHNFKSGILEPLSKFEDPVNGVVCYRLGFINALSCVKVRP